MEEKLGLRRQQEELVTTGNGHLSQSLRGNSMTATVQGSGWTRSMKRAGSTLLPAHAGNDQKSERQPRAMAMAQWEGTYLSTYKTLDSIPNTITKTKPQDQPRCQPREMRYGPCVKP